MSINKVILTGNIGGIKVVNTNDDKKFLVINLATSMWNPSKGKHTLWTDVIVLGERLVRYVDEYAAKGTKVAIVGYLQKDEWTDPNTNQKRYALKVVVDPYSGDIELLRSGSDNPPPMPEENSKDDSSNSGSSGQGQVAQQIDDELPF